MARKKKELPPIESTRTEVFGPDPNDPKKVIRIGPSEVNMNGFSGKYHKLDEPENAEPYALQDELQTDHQYGHTHHLKNQEHYWAGTAAEFKAQFDKL